MDEPQSCSPWQLCAVKDTDLAAECCEIQKIRQTLDTTPSVHSFEPWLTATSINRPTCSDPSELSVELKRWFGENMPAGVCLLLRTWSPFPLFGSVSQKKSESHLDW